MQWKWNRKEMRHFNSNTNIIIDSLLRCQYGHSYFAQSTSTYVDRMNIKESITHSNEYLTQQFSCLVFYNSILIVCDHWFTLSIFRKVLLYVYLYIVAEKRTNKKIRIYLCHRNVDFMQSSTLFHSHHPFI